MQKAERLRNQQNEAISETRANLMAEGHVNAGESTSMNHHVSPNTPKKLPTKTVYQLTPLGNNLGVYNRLYNQGKLVLINDVCNNFDNF